MRSEDTMNQIVVDISDKENAYLKEQEDGSYLFYFYGNMMEVPSADVEAGLYDFYPIIEYEDNSNFVIDICKKIFKIINDVFSKGGKLV